MSQASLPRTRLGLCPGPFPWRRVSLPLPAVASDACAKLFEAPAFSLGLCKRLEEVPGCLRRAGQDTEASPRAAFPESALPGGQERGFPWQAGLALASRPIWG